MKIHALRGENVLRMKCFDLNLDGKGNTIIVSGKNGEGKSSLINSFVLGLGGSKTDVAKLTTKPIRTGAEGAWVEVDLGEYVVKRSWRSNDKDTLTITGKNGAKFGSPQKMLDKILGDLSFDPLAFTRMKPKEQRDLLLSIVDVGIDLAAHDEKRQQIFDKRTEIGRERDRLSGALQTVSGGINAPDQEISIAGLSKKLQEAIQHNAEVQEYDRLLDRAKANVAVAEDALRVAKDELMRAQEDSRDVGDPLPTTEMQRQITEAEETNRAVRAKQSWRDLKKQYELQEKNYAAGTAFLAKLDQEKATALEAAEMPIDGLSLDEDGVTYSGIPFGQLSMSQKIKVSTAIGMAQNPELRVMIVADGSLLDASNLKALESMAEANDFQVFVEMVSDGSGMGIQIEDGEVVSDSPQLK